MTGADVPRARRWLVVDDDDALRARLAQALERRGFAVLACADAAAAVAAAPRWAPARAVVDLRMPGEWGLHAVQQLLAQDPGLRIVVFTAYGSIATAVEALRLGACNFLQKPATVDELLHAFAGPDGASAPAPPAEVASLARTEWEHINRVMTQCDGNIRRTAKLLGLHRRTLQRKLAKFPVRK